jgi:hypothetical protein
MFGEHCSTYNIYGANEYETPSWMAAGEFPCAWGLQPPPAVDPYWYMFGSRHTGITQFAMCDGSVRGMTYIGSSGAGYNNYIYSAGANDGKVIDPSQLPGN